MSPISPDVAFWEKMPEIAASDTFASREHTSMAAAASPGNDGNCAVSSTSKRAPSSISLLSLRAFGIVFRLMHAAATQPHRHEPCSGSRGHWKKSPHRGHRHGSGGASAPFQETTPYFLVLNLVPYTVMPCCAHICGCGRPSRSRQPPATRPPSRSQPSRSLGAFSPDSDARVCIDVQAEPKALAETITISFKCVCHTQPQSVVMDDSGTPTLRYMVVTLDLNA